MGGENPKKEKARLRKGCTVLVCTPGRFLYHLKNTKHITLIRLQYLIIDEADRMLDMGFEKEMTECLSLIKKRCPDKFTTEPDLFHSDKIKINFVSATISPKVQQLGEKLMKTYVQVGFSELATNQKDSDDEDQNIMDSIPRQVKQYWMEVPVQYRLIYLLMFLYAHQHVKVIVFASNCETVNFLHKLLQELDWRNCVNRRGRESKEDNAQVFDFEK